MDYFAEIAEHPDIDEALSQLERRQGESIPERVRMARTGDRSLAARYPGVWRSVLINAFHMDPAFAAEVWRELGSCRTARQDLWQLAEARLLSGCTKRRTLWRLAEARLLSRWTNPLRRALGVDADSSPAEIQRRLDGASEEQIAQARRELNAPYPGPDFIERLLDYPGRDPRFRMASARMQRIADLIANPDEVRSIAETNAVPVPFSMVHTAELDQIDDTRRDCDRESATESDGTTTNAVSPPSTTSPPTSPPPPPRRGPAPAPLRGALNRNLVGLAFSGGGIRSATFNLGVLQALAKLDVLRHCDYLSTVSGGGYIGAWFSAWMRREAHARASQPVPAQTQQQANQTRSAVHTHDLMRQRLSPVHSPNPLDSRIRPIRYLREFSNYLTPQMGFFSADTWTMVAIYFRNMLLNWLVLVPLIAAVLMVPRFLFALTRPLLPESSTALWPESLLLPLMLVPMVVLILNLRRSNSSRSGAEGATESASSDQPAPGRVPWYARQWAIQAGVVVPFLLAACLAAIRCHQRLLAGGPPDIQTVAFVAGSTFFVYLAVIHVGGKFYRSYRSKARAFRALSVATLGAAGAAAGLFWVLGHIVYAFGTDAQGLWIALAFGTPLTLAAYSLIVVVQLGLLGAEFPDEQREWWSRLRAWTLIYSLGWVALFTGALWIPYWVQCLTTTNSVSALFAWALSTFAGVKAGGSAAAAEANRPSAGSAPVVKVPPSLKGRALRIVALVAPYVFVVGLVALVAVGVQWLLLRVWPDGAADYWSHITGHPASPPTFADPRAYGEPSLLLIAMAMLVVSFLVSWRIGVNEFSMHHFYRNRLVRCYLGASRWRERRADWFTGFDVKDDMLLKDFGSAKVYPGPYPIVNAALNLVAGRDLAWQERKATSFVFTPRYCGYDVDRAVLQKDSDGYWADAYAPTQAYVADGSGPTLGTAMAISGAAASPNMGMLTSPASAFLMTVFNARLGWWLPNPRRKRGRSSWDRSGPRLGITYTAIELFGLTDDERRFINLSDGGHFENLGAYELIRRGCRYVIVCDAAQDGAFGLEDLGNLIRKCRIDFGVEIEIATDSIRDRDVKGGSHTHCVVGKIHYLSVPKAGVPLEPDVTGRIPHEEGLLVYLKPSITGDEPFDVLEYYRRVPEFPHESTGDQWFNESQFESYRRLGIHVGETTFGRYREKPEFAITSIPTLFESLRDFWYPSSPKVAAHSTEHSLEYSRIMESLRALNLNALDPVLFSGLRPHALPHRDQFYICNALIQLMESVYADLDLERYWEHPHVGGWMSVFQDWAKQQAFTDAWKVSKSTYAPRFQKFFEDRLQ